MSDTAPVGPALGYAFKTLLGEGPLATEVGLQSHIASDASEDELNAVMDKCRRALERQKAIVDIPNVTRALKANREGLINLRKEAQKMDREAAEAGRKGGRSGEPKMNELDAGRREKITIDEKRYLILIPELEEKLSIALAYRDGETKQKAAKSA